ncbi:ketosteroid isomerase-like protein [Crossiella equi]|uniref:Ketosteroid isomerase-like protein n=1 Tax=Crossiella equi TaxID=130796 RepID=A0ABS5ABJ9_9PSEU|nr:nuclear transport factor 2 family protein [Crossiella equi]MBP2473065.1 ketosteroid isomerase-like protein [Crossiella equi]
MTVTWTAPDGEHPARTASLASMTAVAAGDREGWLALWAEDAVVEDPVGPSLFDPEGKGHHGRAGIAAFWDSTIAHMARMEFHITDSFANGDEVANVGTISAFAADGTRIDTEGVFTYRVGEDGLLRSMRAFWEFDRALATARKTES